MKYFHQKFWTFVSFNSMDTGISFFFLKIGFVCENPPYKHHRIFLRATRTPLYSDYSHNNNHIAPQVKDIKHCFYICDIIFFKHMTDMNVYSKVYKLQHLPELCNNKYCFDPLKCSKQLGKRKYFYHTLRLRLSLRLIKARQ